MAGANQVVGDTAGISTDDLARDLARAVGGDVRFDTSTRAVYSTDASNYRHVPLGVVAPRDVDDVAAALAVCRAHGVAVLPRGAGTSIGGQAANRAVVLDFTRHLRRIVEIDPDARTARVQPGVVLDDLRAAAGRYGLTYGPDPSTHSRCTLGGMIGNNACGSHSVAWGKTVDNVLALDVMTYRGTRVDARALEPAELERRCRAGGPAGDLHRALRDVAGRWGDEIGRCFPDLTRRVSGYNLDQLLPGAGFDLARALVGSEGTCATVLEATVQLSEVPAARALTVLGFPDAPTAADHVLPLLELGPLAVEGLDDLLVAALRAARPDERESALLPPGGGWLFVEMGGATVPDAEAAAAEVARVAGGFGATSVVVADPAAMRRLWRIREDGAGICTRLPDGGEAWPGWEDAAVPPARLGSYLRAFRSLLDRHGYRGAYFGHFGEGCIHVRIDFDLLSAPGVARFRRFMEDAADMVVAHGGSLSGEHGDGQARGELLGRMYPEEILQAFRAFKAAWDPDGKMNPGYGVDPRPLDADLRLQSRPAIDLRAGLALHADGGSFARATRRCMGVGKCITAAGGVMCPSYRATGEERHSTRGRARLLFEMANGEEIIGGWRSPEVAEALDLCLGCKGCKRDCPVTVDMAAYKAEFLSHHYAGRRRPAAHYSMGWLPVWLRAAGVAPRLANAVMGAAPAAAILKQLGGIAPERQLPAVAGESFRRWFAGRPAPAGARDGEGVVLLADTFTNYFDPGVGRAAVGVLEALGYRVEVPRRSLCCGLTWLSTGQLGTARRVLGRTVRTLEPYAAAGVAVVGLEPSCTALLRADGVELLPGSATEAVAGAVRSFAEVVAGALAEGRGPAAAEAPDGPGGRAMVQMHCHQYAEWGFDADRSVLEDLGVATDLLDSGCCGLAGNFGFEKGHYSVSMAAGERVLLPAVRRAPADVDVLADGFSCRTQIRQGTGRRPLHLAELAARQWGLDLDAG